MLASELQVGDWVKPTVCMLGHRIGPARVLQSYWYDQVVNGQHVRRYYVRVLELFEKLDRAHSNTHDIAGDTEVERCEDDTPHESR